MSVAVAGASGGVGKAIVERLSREGVPIRALVRNPYEAVSGLRFSKKRRGLYCYLLPP